MKLRALFVAAFLVSAASAPALAQVKVRDHRPAKRPKPAKAVWDQTGWTKLGDRVVNGKYDRDVLHVGVKEGKFSKLTLVVEDSDLEMYDVVVHFGNGDKHSPSTRLRFEENTRTRVLDLPGTARFVKKIEFRYGNMPGGGKARVEAWGWAVAEPPPPPPPPPAPPPPPPPVWDHKGWTMLGERIVNGRRDRDFIDVGVREGRFDQLTFVVADADVQLKKVIVVFGNGQKFQPKVKHHFKEGQRTRVIDLPGNDRHIKRIELRYKNARRGDRATVQVWGRDTKAGADPGHVWDARGWSYLGEQTVRGRRDRDALTVGKKDVKFTKLTFVVEDDELEMRDIIVEFGNGETFEPKTKLHFKEGSRTRAIDLPGGGRNIKQILFRYGTRGRGQATVKVYGLPVVDKGIKVRDHR